MIVTLHLHFVASCHFHEFDLIFSKSHMVHFGKLPSGDLRTQNWPFKMMLVNQYMCSLAMACHNKHIGAS